MPSPATLAYWEGIILICGLFAVVFWKMMTSEIDLNELFQGEIRNPQGDFDSYVSTGRVQAFLVTIFAALYCLAQVIQDPTEFPTLPTPLVAAVAGSHALYLGGKAQAMLLGPLQDFFNRRFK